MSEFTFKDYSSTKQALIDEQEEEEEEKAKLEIAQEGLELSQASNKLSRKKKKKTLLRPPRLTLASKSEKSSESEIPKSSRSKINRSGVGGDNAVREESKLGKKKGRNINSSKGTRKKDSSTRNVLLPTEHTTATTNLPSQSLSNSLSDEPKRIVIPIQPSASVTERHDPDEEEEQERIHPLETPSYKTINISRPGTAKGRDAIGKNELKSRRIKATDKKRLIKGRAQIKDE
jgi:hypothetical protein